MGFFSFFIFKRVSPVNSFYSALVKAFEANSTYSGWGIGFFQDNVPYIFKKSNHPLKDMRLKNLIDTLSTKALVIHAREASIGDSRESNNHPFRWGSWMGAHAGTITDFRKIKSRINKELPQNLISSIKGNTDSEYFFYSFLAQLKGGGFIKKGEINESETHQSLKDTIEKIENYNKTLKSNGDSTLNSIHTTGNFVIASRLGSPVYYTTSVISKFQTNEKYECGIISTEPFTENDEWQLLPDKTIISIDNNLETKITSI